jgi:hypothetical protein
MPSRIPTKQLPVLLLLFWGAMLVLSISELLRDPHDRLVPAMLVVAFTGLLFQFGLLIRKDQ